MSRQEFHLSDVIKELKEQTGITEETAREFLSAFISTVTDGLTQGKYVDTNSLGTFGISADSQHIIFTPSKELTEIVNAAFSAFVPEELEKEFTIDADNTDLNSDNSPVLGVQKQDNLHELSISEAKDRTEIVIEKNRRDEIKNTDIEEEQYSDDYTYQKNESKIKGWIFALILILGLCIGFITGFVIRPYVIADNHDMYVETMKDTLTTDNSGLSDNVMENANDINNEEESNEKSTLSEEIKNSNNNFIVYDTIRPGTFLTTLSRKHYGGRHEFWIYIYIENKDIISDPQNVGVGTVLCIPDTAKYHINPLSNESIEAANKLIITHNNEQLNKF